MIRIDDLDFAYGAGGFRLRVDALPMLLRLPDWPLPPVILWRWI